MTLKKFLSYNFCKRIHKNTFHYCSVPGPKSILLFFAYLRRPRVNKKYLKTLLIDVQWCIIYYSEKLSVIVLFLNHCTETKRKPSYQETYMFYIFVQFRIIINITKSKGMLWYPVYISYYFFESSWLYF